MEVRDWYLLADIGGTNARFALGDLHSGAISDIETESVADHETFSSALRHYLAFVADTGRWKARPAGACLAVASPTDREFVTFTNSDWVIDRKELADSLKLPEVALINDFEAIGYAVSSLEDQDWVQIGAGNAATDKPIAVLGPGTGLGVCGVLCADGRSTVVSGEGGHVDFAPIDEEEMEIHRVLMRRYRRVSVERLLSGSGLQNIYWALTQLHGERATWETPAQITSAALAGDDALAVETLNVFCRVLGSAAGNFALTFVARGGVYVAGGIAPRVLSFLEQSDFRERFLAKGRFRDYLSDIPTRVVTRDNPGLLGALRFLQSRR